MTYFAPVANLDTVLCRGSFPVDVPSPCHTIGTFQSYVYFVGGSGENGDPSSDESGTVTFADLTATGESYTIGLEHNTSILSVCEGQPHELWLGTSNGITILHEPLREPRTDVLALPPDTCILHLVLTDGGEKIISCDQSGHIDVWCTRKKMKLYMLGVVPLPLSAPIFRASHTRFLCGNHMWSNQEAESGVVLDILSPWGIEGKHTSRRAHPITRKDSAMTVPHTTSPDLIDALILEPLRGVCILWCVRRGSLEAFGIADAPHDVPNHCEFNKGPNVVILTALYHIPFTGVEAPIHAVTLVGSFSDGYDPSSSQELLASWTKEGLKGMNKHEAAFGNSNTSSAASTTPMLMVSSGNRGMISAIHAFSGARLFTETLSQLAKHSASPKPEAGSEAPLLEGCSVNDSGTAETRHLLYVCRAAMDVIWSVTSDARETEPQCVVFTTERLLRQTAAQRLPELSKRIELKCTEENTREVVAKSPVQRAEVGVQSENIEPSPPPVRTYTELELQEMLTEIKASSKLEVDAARTRAAHLEECLDASERQLSLLTESVRDLNDCLENVRLERDRLDTAYKAVLQETVPIVAREYDASSVATPRTVNQQPAGRVGVRALGPNIPSTKMTARGHEVRFGGALSAQHRSATHRNAQQHNSSNRIPVAAPSQQPTRGTSAERLCTPQRSTGLPSVTTGGSMIERAAEPVSHNTGTDHMNGTGILHTLSCELKVHVGELHAVIRDLWGQIESARLQGTAVSAAHVYHLTHAARTIVGSVLAESHALHQGLVVSSTGSVSGNSIAPSTANPK